MHCGSPTTKKKTPIGSFDVIEGISIIYFHLPPFSPPSKESRIGGGVLYGLGLDPRAGYWSTGRPGFGGPVDVARLYRIWNVGSFVLDHSSRERCVAFAGEHFQHHQHKWIMNERHHEMRPCAIVFYTSYFRPFFVCVVRSELACCRGLHWFPPVGACARVCGPTMAMCVRVGKMSRILQRWNRALFEAVAGNIGVWGKIDKKLYRESKILLFYFDFSYFKHTVYVSAWGSIITTDKTIFKTDKCMSFHPFDCASLLAAQTRKTHL